MFKKLFELLKTKPTTFAKQAFASVRLAVASGFDKVRTVQERFNARVLGKNKETVFERLKDDISEIPMTQESLSRALTAVETARIEAVGEYKAMSSSVEEVSQEVQTSMKTSDAELAVQLTDVETTISDSSSKIVAMEKQVISSTEQLAVKDDQLSTISKTMRSFEKKASTFEEKYRVTDQENQKLSVGLAESKANVEAAAAAIGSREQMIQKLQSLETMTRRERDVQAQKVKEANSKMEGIVTVLEATTDEEVKQPVKNALVDAATRKSMTKEEMLALKDKMKLDLAKKFPSVPKSGKAELAAAASVPLAM